MKRYFIGGLSKKFNINPKTIRFYESIGILPEPAREENGYRIYGDKTLERINFIIKAKSQGFRLNEIKEIINIYNEGKRPCAYTKKLIKNKINEIELKISGLKELNAKLKKCLKEKTADSGSSICPMIEKK
ncbi:MAG TPA: MerR family transcriptional regulator [bacterium]|nr:MerR family transcriptional regulator [bacterium]